MLHLLRPPPEGLSQGLWVDEKICCPLRQALVSITPASYRSLRVPGTFPLSIIMPILFYFLLLYLSFFIFLVYENMITGNLEIQKKVTYSSTLYYNCSSRYIKIFSWSFNIELSEVNSLNVQRNRRL